MLYLSLFCASVSKTSPKVIASSLNAILTYKGFHRTTVLSDSGENIHKHETMSNP